MLQRFKLGAIPVFLSFYLLFFIYKVNKVVEHTHPSSAHAPGAQYMTWGLRDGQDLDHALHAVPSLEGVEDRTVTNSVSVLSCHRRLKCKALLGQGRCLACSLLNLSVWQSLPTCVFKKYLLSE